MSLTKQIVISLIAGVLTGLFFGEYCNFLSYIGDGFISLLQMTVLPFIMVSIIANLGRISMHEGKDLLVKGLKTLLLLLAFGVAALVILPFSMPEWSASSFFTPSLTELKEEINFLDLYIPSNPFGSMAKNVVPAVVLFSIFLGIALSGIKEKEILIKNLDILTSALNQINKMIIKLTPLGVFAIAAYNAGTMTPEELERLYAYIVIYTLAVVLLAFYWLPLLINSLTDIKPKKMFGATKDTLLTIFATGKIIIVLPQLIDNIKTLFAQQGLEDDEVKQRTELIMPLAYPFPNLGTFVIFIFVPFTAWYVGQDFSFVQRLIFIGATIPSSFVAPVTGIPFLLDLMKLPQDMFQLFVISSVYTDRIRVVLGAVHLIALTLITVQWSIGKLKVRWGKLIRGSAVGLLLTIGGVVATHYYLGYVLGKNDQYSSLVTMNFNKKYKSGKIVTLDQIKPDSVLSENRLKTILSRGVLRVGYYGDRLPFAFRNEKGELIGFDIEMAYDLADEMNVKPEFVKLPPNKGCFYLNKGYVDIIMSGQYLTTELVKHCDVSRSYMDQTLAFIVPDYLRDHFNSLKALKNAKNMTVGVTDTYFARKLKAALPNVKVKPLHSPRVFFKQKEKKVDALLYFAEAGSAWTLIYPSYSIAVPHPVIIKIPLVYTLPSGSLQWKEYVNSWIALKVKDGTVERVFKYWIEGEGAKPKTKRWSVIRDVLHWVD